MEKRKKAVFMTDSSFRKTGFGRNIKEILLYLYRTGKYDLVEYCCGTAWSVDPEHQRKPWKSYGALPDAQAELNAIAPNDQAKRMIAYGPHYLDKVIYQEKPDVFFAIQDIWGIDFAADRQWFDKITSVFWTTLDSLPILDKAIEIAPKVKNFWVWSEFAERAMKKLGLGHIKTLHGAINDSYFRRLSKEDRANLRAFHGVPQDAFVIGFVFRNQPRKSVASLLEGYKMFKLNNLSIKNPRLLFHTHWNEGWNLHKFLKEYEIPEEEVLTTHICEKCRSFRAQPHTKEHVKCPFCGNEESFVTTHPGLGISESQLNEIYNLMDVYTHPFNSGGQEIPVQEAKLTELITLVTNYSCGEDMCEEGAGSLKLDWSPYREPETQFIKATTNSYSICKQLTKVFNMPTESKEKIGKQAREWVISKFSTKVVAKTIENFIDESPFTTYDFKEIKEIYNPQSPLDNKLDDLNWLIQLYQNVLGRTVDKYDTGVRNWLEQIKRGIKREQIEGTFRQMAAQKAAAEFKEKQLEQIKAVPCKKLLYVMPASERDIFLSTALFRSVKEQYPNHRLYVATDIKYFGALDGNPYVDEIIPYFPEMDNLFFLEGSSNHEGYFDIAFLPFWHTQRSITYTHNSMSNIAFKECIKY